MSLNKGTVRAKDVEAINQQDVTTIKEALALENVDNTSDADKPISTDTQNALDLKADDSSISSVGKTGNHSDLNLDDGTNPHNTNQSDVGLGNVDNTSDLNKPVSTATQDALDLKLDTSLKGSNNGLAELDGSGLVPSSQLPSFVDDVIEVSSFSNLPTTGESGKIYITLDTNEIYRWASTVYVEISDTLSASEVKSLYESNPDTNVFTDAEQTKLGNQSGTNTGDETTASIQSKRPLKTVEGNSLEGTGDINITQSDVGLGNVDNTSDLDKPVSNATQNALDDKVDKVSGQGLSDENYTLSEKDKLGGIESGAEVNIVDSVNTQTGDVVLDADDINDSNTNNKFTTQSDINRLANTSGTNTGDQDISGIQTNASDITDLQNNKVDKVAGQGLSDENYTLAEKNKLSGIESGAEVNIPETITNLSITGNTLTYVNENGTNQDIDLSLYLDDTNLARIISGEYVAGDNVLRFTRDDGSTFDVDASMFFDDTNLVTSVNTQTGDVVLDADDINDSTTANKFTSQADINRLANTSGTNTGDQDISGIQTNASDITDLQNDKVDKVAGKGLSTEDYTTNEKNKLAGIESGAEVNTVDSVNTQTGDVVLDADDINDSNTNNKFTTQSDINRLANTSGTNTGDQDLSNYVDRSTNQTIDGEKTFTQDVTIDGGIYADNSLGTSGQILSSTGTSIEWVDSAGGGAGLEGTQYVYVQANGTDTENAQELQDAYDLAKTKVVFIATPSENSINTVFYGVAQTINNGSNSWFNEDGFDETLSLGVQNVEVVSDEFTGIIEIDVTYSDNVVLEFNYSGTQLTNVTSITSFIIELKRTTVIAGAGYYNFSSDFVMDEEYVDLVSLDGNRSVIFNGTGSISITENDVFVKGVDVVDKNFTIGDDLNLLKVENCKGGDFSFGGDETGGANVIASGTFTNCEGGDDSFGGDSGTASGTFIDCKGGEYSFGGGNDGTASGTFTDCKGGNNSFGGGGGTASGTFKNCEGKNKSFGGRFLGTASGIFTNCEGGDDSFGGGGSFSGTVTASGTFTNCEGGDDSFGGGIIGTLSGKLYYCRLTSGTFETVSSGGITRLCIDGNNDENNQG